MAFQFALSVSHDDLKEELWLQRMKESGIRYFEYSCGPFPYTRDLRSNVEKLLPRIEQGDFSFPSVHLPAWFGADTPGQINDFERDLCVRKLRNFIENAAPLGMKNLTLHPGGLPEGQTRAECVTALRRTVEALVPTVEKYQMSLNVELCPCRSIGHLPEEMEQVLADMPPCVGLCFDVNHPGDRWAEIPEWIGRLGKYIRTFHISDCDEYDECHWMPGVGVLDWEAIMTEIRKLERDFLLIYEISHGGYSPPASQKRLMDPRFFFKAVKSNMKELEKRGK